MTLWFFDTSTRELVYREPTTGVTAHFHLGIIGAVFPVLNEIDLRKLPRFNKSSILRIQ